MRILSIDFDYFQDVDSDTLSTCYPNGVDRTTSESIEIWKNIYNNESKNKNGSLENVRTNEWEFLQLIELLRSQKSDCDTLIAQSHKDVFDFAVEHFEKSKSSELFVTNIDMHHDFLNDNEQLDCGNWVKFLFEKYNTSEKRKLYFDWIAHPSMLHLYGLDQEPKATSLIKISVADIRVKEYDAIFLCRSDNWLPPHLDKDFCKLVDVIQNHFSNVEVRDEVNIPRQNFQKCKTVKMQEGVENEKD